MKDRPDSAKDLEAKMEKSGGAQQEYKILDDNRLWKVGVDVFMVFAVFIASGFAVRAVLDHFIDPNASKVADKNFQKNM